MATTAPRTDLRGLWPVLAAAALGLLHAASFSPPLASGWLQIVSLSGLFLLLRSARGAHARIARVMAFGFAWFASGVGWLYISMHTYGGMPSVLAGAAVALFAGYLALFPLAATAAAHGWAAWRSSIVAGSPQIARGAPPGSGSATAMTPADAAHAGIRWSDQAAALALAGCWGLSELLRGWLFTGFPWLSIGYAHVDSPLAGFAPWVGVYGIGMLAALMAGLLALLPDAFRQPTPAPRIAAILAILLVIPVGGSLLANHEPTQVDGPAVQVRLAQGNVPQQMKFDPQHALDAMLDYLAMIESSNAQLVVLPETAWTVPWSRTPETIATRLLEDSKRSDMAIAIGMPLPSALGRYTNSVALIADGAPRARYDKRHLVPFGEFIPTGFGWFVQLMQIPLGDFGRGSASQTPFEIAGQRFAFNICYEDLFGEELLGAIRDGGATVLVNVSNIAWFGDSSALPQHLAISRMRSLETGRPMLRATNTGATASIDHRGRVLAKLPYDRRGILDVRVQGTSGMTAYVRAGNLLPIGLAALMLACAGTARQWRRRRRR